MRHMIIQRSCIRLIKTRQSGDVDAVRPYFKGHNILPGLQIVCQVLGCHVFSGYQPSLYPRTLVKCTKATGQCKVQQVSSFSAFCVGAVLKVCGTKKSTQESTNLAPLKKRALRIDTLLTWGCSGCSDQILYSSGTFSVALRVARIAIRVVSCVGNGSDEFVDCTS